MKRLLLLLLLLIPTLAYGQGSRFDSVAQKTVQGFLSPIPGATITVCSAAGAGTPCTPVVPTSPVTLCTDSTCAMAAANPFLADSNGNFGFWAIPGTYKVSVTAPGVTGYLLTVVLPVTLSGSNTFTGSTTLNNTGGAGANDLTLGIINQRRYACSLAAPVGSYRFPTVVAAANDITTNSTTGGVVETCPGHRETITTTFALGTSTKPVIVLGAPDTILTCNVSGGTDCWQVGPNSGFVGQGIFSNGGTRTGSFTLSVASTANFGNLIVTQQCNSVGGQSSIRLEDLYLQGNNSATGTTMLNLCSLNNQPSLYNIFVAPGTNNTGILIQASSASGAVLGPMSLFNVFVDCSNNAGCHPAKITNAAPPNANSTQSIDWNGGYINHPGAGIPALEINGNTTTSKSLRGVRIKTYFETTQSATSLILKIVDATAIDLTNSVFNIQDTDTAVDISESGAGRTGAISFSAIQVNSPTAACTLLNNHITGKTVACSTNVLAAHYNFGGETSANAAPFTVDGNAMSVTDGGLGLTGSTVLPLSCNETLNDCLSMTDTEGGGKAWKMGGGVLSVNRFSFVNKTDGPNTEAFGCANGTTATCGFPGLVIGTANPTATTGFVPSSAGGKDLGLTALPWGNLWLGTAATNNFKFQPAAVAAARTITIADPLQASVGLPMTIASGTKALNTASITTATCDAGVAATATGTLSTDVVNWSFNAAPTATNKYGAFLVVYAVPSANTVTFYTCNPSATTSTPTAMTVNWTVVR